MPESQSFDDDDDDADDARLQKVPPHTLTHDQTTHALHAPRARAHARQTSRRVCCVEVQIHSRRRASSVDVRRAGSMHREPTASFSFSFSAARLDRATTRVRCVIVFSTAVIFASFALDARDGWRRLLRRG